MRFCSQIAYLNPEDVQEALKVLIWNEANMCTKFIEGKTAFDCVTNKSLLTVRSQQLLQGTIKMNRTKEQLKIEFINLKCANILSIRIEMNEITWDCKFKEFMREHLDKRLFDKLSELYISELSRQAYNATFLSCISVGFLHEDILALIDQFLANLSFECASKYVCAHNIYSCSLIFYCANVDLIKRIIKYIPDINVRNYYGSSALMYACNNGTRPLDLDIVQFFLDHGANVNAQNCGSETALMWLCMKIKCSINENVEQAIELLIFSGADPFMKSEHGYTAYDYVSDKSLLSERSLLLLQGNIKMNNTKRAQ